MAFRWQKEKIRDNVRVVLTDLPKAFDSIPHDLLVAKFDAYGFNRDTIAYIYPYLKNRKQCVWINST